MVTVLLATIALTAGMASSAAHSAGPWRADAGNTRGWQLMTPEERLAHQGRIRAFDSYSACQVYQAEHHRLMDERAKQQGRVLEPERRDFCVHLKPPAAGR